jgi:hypothetical protein
MALVGNIRDFGLSDFLYLIDRGYKTGCLHLSRGSEAAILFFEKGKLVYATRGSQSERLVDLLAQSGKLTPQQLQQARSLHINGTPVAQELINNRIVARDDLQKALQAHVEESVYGLFGWPDGEFRFEQNQKPEADAPTMPMHMPVEHLIMEGVRRIDEWGRIKDRIPSSDMVVRFVDQPGEKAKGIQLAPEEWRVFARINGRDTLLDIAGKTSLSEFDVCRIVYGFLTAGLVDVIKRPRPQQPIPGAARPQQPPEAMRVKKSLVNRIINRIRGM